MQPEPARIFLRDMKANTGSPTLTQRLESLVSSQRSAYERALLADLPDVLALPSLEAAGSAQDTDVVLDVILQGYRVGSATDVSLGAIGWPLWWRPQVGLAARIHRRNDDKLISSFEVTEAMPWQAYALRALSWRVLLGQEPLARRRELDVLLRRAVNRLLQQLPTLPP